MNKTKKILCMLIVFTMLLSVVSIGAMADETVEFGVTASIDYDTSIVTVEVTTPEKYVQKISVVMYKKGETISSSADIIRAIDLYTDGSKKVTGTITLGNDIMIGENDIYPGYLMISAEGSGRNASSSKATTEIYFESERSINEVTLPAIQTANRAQIETILRNKADMLGIDMIDFNANTDTICNLFLAIRDKDYGGKCQNMGVVEDILSGVALIRNLDGASAATCKTLCEGEATLLGLDVNNVYYKDNEFTDTTTIYTYFKANMDNQKPTCIKDVKDDLFQSISIANFNARNAESLAPIAALYMENFGITDYATNCTLYGAVNINKAFAQQGFSLPKDVVDAYNNAVSAVKPPETEEENPDTDLGGEDDGDGDGGGGGGGGSYKKEEVGADTELMNKGDNASLLPELPVGSMFNDVPKTHWAYAAINNLHSMGVIDGVSTHMYDPDSFVTREAFVKMLVMAFNIYDETALTVFTDMMGHWANIYVASAQVKGIVTGLDNATFGVGRNITRQDAAVMLKRTMDKTGVKLDSINSPKEFLDSAEIAEYAKESIDELSSQGVINGVTETHFEPLAPLTRAQAAQLIYGVISR